MAESVEHRSFQRAVLKSESQRIVGILGLLCVLFIGVFARNLAAGQRRLLLAQTLALALAIAYESFASVVVKKALRSDRRVPRGFWFVNVIVESGIPTLGLFILVESQVVNPREALVAPAVFLYFIFIILSTLRLSPGVSLATGVLSALGYVAVVFYVRGSYADADDGTSVLPYRYLIYATVILTGGIAAAIVASQIKKHVYSALREAELQHELDRVNHDLDVARSIQQDLLPGSPPGLGGFEIAGWNRPADQTGGDYFDWQTLPDGRIAVSLADATGHGIGPALVSASCRAYARASLLSGKSDGLLENLNKLLSDDLPPNRFVTFAVVFLEPNCSLVRVLSAGHGPILWYKRDSGEIENIEAQGIPLGMIDGFAYGQAAEARMAAGDILALITDGFFEWENPEGEQFGISRLEAVIHEARECSAEELILRLRSAVESFCGGTKQEDDLTAVILKRK